MLTFLMFYNLTLSPWQPQEAGRGIPVISVILGKSRDLERASVFSPVKWGWKLCGTAGRMKSECESRGQKARSGWAVVTTALFPGKEPRTSGPSVRACSQLVLKEQVVGIGRRRKVVVEQLIT